MTVANCFDAQSLKDYLLGKLSDEESDVIAAHLEACLTCEATMSQIDRASDTLTDGLRLPVPPCSSEVSANESLRRALDNAQALESRSHAPRGNASFRRSASLDRSADVEGHAERGNEGSAIRDGSLLRDYRLLESLGSGGMGTVFKAVHSRLDRLVAVKLLPARRLCDQQAVARFQREMRVIGQLSHPAIVQATDAGEVDGTHFLVMEFVEGCDLNKIARAVGTLSIPDACEMARQAAVGLEYAHQQGIIHRDIKPSNLMLAFPVGGQALRNLELAGSTLPNGPTPFGQFRIPKCLTPVSVKILDLGLALLSGEQAPVDELTTVGQLMGTLDYMAPEQLEDSHLVGPRADIYALAATLFRLLTGSAPFAKENRKTPLQKLRALATQAAPPIRDRRADIPADLAAIIDRALSREPNDRLATMVEFAAALAPWCDGHDLAALARLASESKIEKGEIGIGEPGGVSPRTGANVSPAAIVRGLTPAGSPEFVARSAARLDPPRSDGRRTWKLLGAALLLLAALAAVITIQTNNGQLVIETMRDGVEVRIKKAGRIEEQFKVTTKSGKSTKLTAGEYEIEFVGPADGLTIDKKQFVLKRGEVVIAKVSEVKDVAFVSMPDSQPDAFDPGPDSTSQAAPKTRIIKPEDIVDRNAKGMESFEAANPDWQAEKKIRERLLKKIDIVFDNTPLTEVVETLEQQSGVVMLLDIEALNDEAIPLNSPVTRQLSEVPVSVAMQLILRPLKLTWTVDADQVLITTATKEAEHLVTRTYPVGKLLPGVRLAIPRLQENAREQLRQGNGGGGFFDVPSELFPRPMTIRRQFGRGGGFGGGENPKVDNAIIVTPDGHFSNLLQILSTDSWSNNGGAGTCQLIHNVLSVRQTPHVHSLIEALLRAVESAFLEPLTEPVEIRPFGYPLEADRRLREQLTKPLDADFTNATLTDVASDLVEQLQVQILIDVEALNDDAIPLDSPITRNLKNVPATVLMRRMFQPLKLEVQVEHGLLLITTMTKATEGLVTKVYDIREFVARGVSPEQIIAGLESGTSGDSWESSGGAGQALDFADTLLVIKHTMSVHDEIAKFLTRLHTQLHDQPEIPRVITASPKKPQVATTPRATQPTPAGTPPKSDPPAKTADTRPRYDGKTFDEWLTILDVERSPAKLSEAFRAFRSLADDPQAQPLTQTVAQRVLKLFRIVDPNEAWGHSGDRQSLLNDFNLLFAQLPKSDVANAVVTELRAGNARSRMFLFVNVVNLHVGYGGLFGMGYYTPEILKLQLEPISSEVLKLARDKDQDTRLAAIWWLAQLPRTKLPTPPQIAIEAQLSSLLAEDNGVLKLAGVRGLIDFEADTVLAIRVAEAIAQVLAGKADDQLAWEFHQPLRYTALRYAALMGPRAAPAADAIAQVLREPDQWLPGVAPGTGGGFFSVMQFARQPQVMSYHEMSAFALARIGKSAAKTLPIIEKLLKDQALKSANEAPRSWVNLPTPDDTKKSVFEEYFAEPIALNELLLAARLRLQEKPVPDLTNTGLAEEVSREKHEQNTLALSHFKLLREELALLQAHFGLEVENDTLRELNTKLDDVRLGRKLKSDDAPKSK